MTINKQWLINGNPRGRGITVEDFLYHEASLLTLEEGQIRTKVEYLSFDPSQKGQLENVSGYAAVNDLGNVMPARGIGEVIESKNSRFKVGDKVTGRLGWQEISTNKPNELEVVPNDDLLTARLGPLGTSGLTAYFGLLRIGKPEPGDNVVVSGAAGSVGSITGQIAKLMGCTTIGIAGGEEKCQWLVDEVGYDSAIDYKNENIKARLREICPNGVNVFFDNVGGIALDHTLARIAPFARIVICGGISRYEQEALPAGPANYFNIVFRQATMEGFLLSGYERENDIAIARITDWIRTGKIIYQEDLQEGFENIPQTLLRIFTGENRGKQLLKL